MEVTNQDLLQVNEVVSKRWHKLFYILQFCYIFFWLCCFFQGQRIFPVGKLSFKRIA